MFVLLQKCFRKCKKGARHTNVVHDHCHFVQLLGAHIWAICEAEIDNVPLPDEVILCERLAGLCLYERKGATDKCLAVLAFFDLLPCAIRFCETREMVYRITTDVCAPAPAPVRVQSRSRGRCQLQQKWRRLASQKSKERCTVRAVDEFEKRGSIWDGTGVRRLLRGLLQI